MSEELKPCPFCGSDEITYRQSPVEGEGAEVFCVCGVGFSSLTEHCPDPRPLWNQRTPETYEEEILSAIINAPNPDGVINSFKSVVCKSQRRVIYDRVLAVFDKYNPPSPTEQGDGVRIGSSATSTTAPDLNDELNSPA